MRKYKGEESNQEDLIKEEYEIKENTIKLEIMSAEEIELFYKDHGDHMKQVMQNTVETKRKRELFVKIKDQKFTSGGTVKTFCKRMILKYKNWSKINVNDSEFLNEIVK